MVDTKTDQGVKLFVGQIHQMTEPEVCSTLRLECSFEPNKLLCCGQLRKMFEPFGQVTDCLGMLLFSWIFSLLPNVCVVYCAVLRDRVTNSLKGCGFITFAEKSSADAAIASMGPREHAKEMIHLCVLLCPHVLVCVSALHDQVTVHETKKPLQVKYAGGNDSYSGGGSHAGGGQTQDIDDSKLFVGVCFSHSPPLTFSRHSLKLLMAQTLKLESLVGALICCVRVGMLSKTTTQDQVRAIFSPYGAVAEVFIMKDPISGASKG